MLLLQRNLNFKKCEQTIILLKIEKKRGNFVFLFTF